MTPVSCGVLIIGGGPAGYVCAIRAGQLGLDTALVERDRLGGVCLNVGCIPSKALIHAAAEFERAVAFGRGAPTGVRVAEPTIDLAQTVAWKDGLVSRLTGGVQGLLQKAKVRILKGEARFLDGKTCSIASAEGELIVSAEHVVIATGSESVDLPSLPLGGPVISSTEALSLTAPPPRLAIVGGGYIGLELGMAYCKLGSAVTVIEAAERLLPQYDAELTRPVAKSAARLGIATHLRASARGFDATGGLAIEFADGGTRQVLADSVLVTVGRRPRTEGFGLDQLGLAMNGAAIGVDEQCRTSMRHVWAIGDVVGEPMLAHRAMAQGAMVAEAIAGQKRAFDPVAIPAICFTDPEIVSAGLAPDDARAGGVEVKVGVFPFAANGRAMTMEADEGFVRIVARADNHLTLGFQAVGRGVSELAAGFGLALEMGCRLEDIAGTIHAHPTLGECVQEAALKALGRALHTA